MAHWAELDQANNVLQVIVIEDDVIASWPGTWMKTSYNTRGGVHLTGGTPLRKNYAGIGDIYDPVRDAFYAPSPGAGWVLDEATCWWVNSGA